MKKQLVKVLYIITGLTTVIGALLKITHKAGYLIFSIGIILFVLIRIIDEIGKQKDK